MRVGFVVGTLGRGGAERQLLYMLMAVSDAGIEARVLCLTKGEALEKDIHDLGIDVEWIGATPNKLVRLSDLIRNVQKRPVDILQSSHFFTNIYAAAAGRVLNVPSIGAIRNDLASEIAANGIFGRWQLSLPGAQIANSKLALERAIERGYPPSKIYLLSNVVAETNQTHARRKSPKTRLLFAGRLVQQKRPERFIELASQLRKLLPNEDLEFIIAGDGPLRPELLRLANVKGLQSDAMKFFGERAAMADIYRSSDLLISTSAHEGTPNVVLEAMAHSIPVVATRVGGVPELVDEGRGFLVEPDDLDGLVNAPRTLVLDRDLRYRMGKQAREYVRKDHSFEYLQKRLTGIYSRVLAKDNATSEYSTTAQ